MTNEEWEYHRQRAVDICGYLCSRLKNGLFKIEGQAPMTQEQMENWCYSRNAMSDVHGKYLRMRSALLALV